MFKLINPIVFLSFGFFHFPFVILAVPNIHGNHRFTTPT